MEDKKGFFLPSMGHLFFIVLLIAIAIRGGGILSDGDSGFHIRAGDFIINNMKIPKVDIFSYVSPPIPWTAHEWLSEVIMSFIHKCIGLSGLAIFFMSFIAFSFYVYFKLLRVYCNNVVLLWPIVFFAALCTSFHWLARPHVFSMLILILWYMILDLYEYRNINKLFYLPVLMLLWVNLHGGYIIGYVLIFIYIFSNFINGYFFSNEDKTKISQKAKKLLFICFICFGVSLLNPFGYKIFLFPFKLVTDSFITSHVMEFLPTNFQDNQPFNYFFFFSIFVILFSKMKPDLTESILFFSFSYLALYSVRYTALFAIIIAPILLKRIDLFFKYSEIKMFRKIKHSGENISVVEKRNRGLLWPIILVVLLFYLGINGTIKYDFDLKRHAIEATEFILKEKIPGNMFNDDEFGDYLIYAAYPLYKVFFDGRSDMYGERHMKKYLSVLRLENDWQNIIEEYQIGWIFYKADSLLSRYLNERNDWKLIYADGIAHIYVKNIDKYKALVEKYSNVTPVIYN